jgi:hypothetical protein
MSKWDKYEVKTSSNNGPYAHGATLVQPTKSRWDKYEVKTLPEPKAKEDDWGKFAGKSALKGITGLADLPANLAHLTERGGRSLGDYYRKLAGKEAKFDKGAENDTFSPEKVDRPSKWIKKAGVDIEPEAGDNALKRIAGHGIEFASSAGPFGMLGKATSGLNRLSKIGKQAAISGGVGATSGIAQEAGVNPLMADIGASVLAPSSLKTPSAIKRVAEKSMGLRGKKFNLEAAKNAKELGIDLPTATLTNSGIARTVEEGMRKVPYFGEKIKNKYKRANEQTQKVIEDILEKTGPKRTPEWEKINRAAYEKAEKIPAQAKIAPDNTWKAINSIKSDALIQSPDLKNLFKDIKEIKRRLSSNKEQPIKALVETKQQLNDIIKWDTPTSVKDRLKVVQKGLQDDLATYGQKNPKWYKDYKAADAGFASMKRREKVDQILTQKVTDHASGEIRQNSLAKIVNHPNSSKLLEKNLGKENFEKLKKLSKVSEAFVSRSKDVLNPSGTATTLAIPALIGGFFTYPVNTLKLIGGGVLFNKMLTNQKWIDAAIKCAENPTTANNLLLNNLTKQISGHSLYSLSNELKRSTKKDFQ